MLLKHLIVFVLLSLVILAASWRTVFNFRTHGFYRYFGWEGTLWLAINNYRFWFESPFSPNQLASWLLFLVSVVYLLAGSRAFFKTGRISSMREDKHLFGFEKTTNLVDSGLYAFIRHPLYGSLLFLTWGIALKHPQWLNLIVALTCTVFYYLTSLVDEKECLAYFGDPYRSYMKRTRMFIPYLF